MQPLETDISLTPLTPLDKSKFYQWATNSEATPFWYRSPYGDEIPSREEFFDDYDDHYFNQIRPYKKGEFAIVLVPEDRETGVINYQVEWVDSLKYYDMDILIASNQDKSKGNGFAAISYSLNMLSKECLAENFVIRAHTENIRAQKAHAKAGFLMNKKYKDLQGFE